MTGSRARLLWSGRRRLLFLHGLQRGQDAIGPGIDADRRQIAPANDPVAVNHVERPGAFANFVLVGAVGVRYRAFWLEIRQQRKVQVAVAGKCQVPPPPVSGDPNDLSLEAAELRE